MITAKAALDIYEQSKVRMEERLDKLNDKIIEASNLGKRELWLSRAFPHAPEYCIKHNLCKAAELTPLQHIIKAEVEKLGFILEIKYEETQIGGGLGSMGDEIKYESLPYLRLSW